MKLTNLYLWPLKCAIGWYFVLGNQNQKKKKDLGFIKKPQLLMSKNYKIYIILGSWNTGHANHPIEFYFIS